MKVRLILDSSANQLANKADDVQVVPLTLTIGGQDFIDNEQLNIADFIEKMAQNKVAGKTTCPSIDSWLKALEGAKQAIIITITSGLSGSYSSAYQAKALYEEKYPDRQVLVIDSRSAGPELSLILLKIKQLLQDDKLRFVDLEEKIAQYCTETHLLFILQSLHNLALNGRVSNAVSKVAGMLKINLLGRASNEGKLEPLTKIRGMKKALNELNKHMTMMRYKGGKVIIDHCQNEKDALTLKEKIKKQYPNAQILIRAMRGLCAFYAEKGGLMVGFEG